MGRIISFHRRRVTRVYRRFFPLLVLCVIGSVIFFVTSFLFRVTRGSVQAADTTWWQIQSIDTMKYSRDLAREKLGDASFDFVIATHVEAIAKTGATHVAIGTPYDDEFFPLLLRWVQAARKYNLRVWFRGNWSGWEQWFGYRTITADEHKAKTAAFIDAHSEIFRDGDIFTPCPECENGALGDPRNTRKLAEYRAFLIDLYQICRTAFARINTSVTCNLFSMNGDVARLVMDRETTEVLGGVVTIDHYVKTANQLITDVQFLREQSGGKIVLGEFGAPILDIHGKMTEKEQAAFLKEVLNKLSQVPDVIGINYWVHVGGSTQIWRSDGTEQEAVSILSSFFHPSTVTGVVRNEIGQRVIGATVQLRGKSTKTDTEGKFMLPMVGEKPMLDVAASGYAPRTIVVDYDKQPITIRLTKERESFWFRILKYFFYD